MTTPRDVATPLSGRAKRLRLNRVGAALAGLLIGLFAVPVAAAHATTTPLAAATYNYDTPATLAQSACSGPVRVAISSSLRHVGREGSYASFRFVRRAVVAAEDGTALARQLGTEGERLAGIDPAAKVRIPSASGTAAYRIPDALTDTTLTEVKNVARLGYTNQLQDFEAYASGSGRAFDLVVRQNTVLTQELQGLENSGVINVIRRLPAR